MPFDFLRRKKPEPIGPEPQAAEPEPTPGVGGSSFEGLTEEWRLSGRMHVRGRLSDTINKREPIAISDVSWAPIDGSAAFEPVPGLKSIDPYDLIIVLAGEDSLPPLTEEQRVAHRIHKVAYEVALEVPPYRVVGTVYLYPGTEPERLMERGTEMFVPVVDATAHMGAMALTQEPVEAILVNRFYLRGVEQIDSRTGKQHTALPGGSMGGADWEPPAGGGG